MPASPLPPISGLRPRFRIVSKMRFSLFSAPHLPFPVKTTTLVLGIGLTTALSLGFGSMSAAQASTIKVHQSSSGQWTLQEDGTPLPVRGVAIGSGSKTLDGIAQTGATVVRTYGEPDVWTLDQGQKDGLHVIMGLWMGHPRHGFSYTDPASVNAQETRILNFVRAHKDHPALLAWGIGNEVETGVSTPATVWAESDRLAAKIKAIDPDHPTMMVVADTSPENLKTLATCCSHVDILGVNAYGESVFSLPHRLAEAGIRKPVIVTEFGPIGQWQAAHTPWGAPIEPTSTEKADYFRKAIPFLQEQPQILGEMAFLWGAKQEQTATWHGLLLDDGSRLGAVDALTEVWRGEQPQTHAPVINAAALSADTFRPGAAVSAGLSVDDPDGDKLSYDFSIRKESTDLRKGGDWENRPETSATTIEFFHNSVVLFDAPRAPGPYRLFITIHDGTGKAATANLPFQVQGETVAHDKAPNLNAASTRKILEKEAQAALDRARAKHRQHRMHAQKPVKPDAKPTND